MPTPPTTPAYSPGLEGVVAGESAICAVDPNAGLLYRGYDVHELAQRVSFEEVAWLLLRGELPDTAQDEGFREELIAARHLPPPVIQMLRLLPKDMHPVDALRTGVSMLAGFEPQLDDHSHPANVAKAVRLIAKVSTVVTASWRIAHDHEPLELGEDLSFAGRFLFSLTGKQPETWQTTAMNTILILYAEHEFNASTFSARVTASTLSDMYAAVTSAIGTLKGALHGGANEAAMKVLREVGSPANAERWVGDRVARKEKIMGFGHRVYRTGDSRVPMMRQLARDIGQRVGQAQWHDICAALEAAMENQKKLYANLDLYAAPVLHMLGLPAALNTPLFAVSRVSGWCAHVIEQHDHNRLIRPRSLYTGPPRREVPVR
jgi:2-methylcitrate synthase/citrate synthase II